MPKVEIAHDVYAALQRRAVPFEDNINDVIRRLLRGDRTTYGNALERPNGAAPGLHAVIAVPGPSDASVAAADNNPSDERNVVVRRRRATTPATANATGDHLAQSTVRSAVLGILNSTGDTLSVVELTRGVERQLRSRMTDCDLEALPSGLPRWQNQIRNALTQLQHEAHIERLADNLYRSRNAPAVAERGPQRRNAPAG